MNLMKIKAFQDLHMGYDHFIFSLDSLDPSLFSLLSILWPFHSMIPQIEDLSFHVLLKLHQLLLWDSQSQ